MRPEHLQYAESLKADLLSANQPFSSEVVERLLQERAELLAVVDELVSVERRAGVGKELMNRAKVASTKARAKQ